MYTRLLCSFIMPILLMLCAPVYSQTSVKGDTVSPAAEQYMSTPTPQSAMPSFDRLTAEEQAKVLQYIIEQKGITMDQVMNLAYAELPEDAKKDVMDYSDFMLMSREEMPVTSVKYQSDIIEFGVLKIGESKIKTMTFTNTGSKPYVITEAASSCPCLEVQFDETPVMPGQTGEVRFVLNSAGYEPVPVEISLSIRDNSGPNRRQLKKAVGAFELKKPKRNKL